MNLVSRKSQYITSGEHRALTTRNNHAFMAFFTSFVAVIILCATVFTTIGGSLVALADSEDDAKNKISTQANDFMVKDDNGDANLMATLDKANGDTSDDSFAYILNRLFSTTYINKAPLTSVDKSSDNFGDDGFNCHVDDPNAGTPLYHNCDVPNIVTEFLQDALSTLTQSGPEGADITSAKLDVPQFGLPTDIPGNGAPVKASDRQVKYTALELFGYNLKYTSYKGEWDHIKVMTAARSMSNFGFMDNLKLGVSAVLNGIASGVGQGVTNFVSSLSSGDVFGAIGGFFSGLFGGGGSAVINTVLDTSDQNVFNTYAWYRIGYGGTLYNAREKTGEEIAGFAKAQLLKMIMGSTPDEAKTPDDLASIQGGLPDPKEAISKCMFKNASGNMQEYGKTTIAPGPTEAKCKEQADKAANAANENRGEDDPEVESKYEWSEDGTQKLETIEDWKNNNADALAIAEKYNMGVTIDTNEANRANTIASVKSTWDSKWSSARTEILKEDQEVNNSTWMNQQLSPEYFANWVTADKSRNYNAPWNRFVCTDSSGKDLRDGDGNLIALYDSAGNLNSKCSAVRAPIQNGFFGNGYVGTTVAQDTRYAVFDTSVFGTLIPLESVATGFSNAGLWIAVMATRVSNTVMNLAFSPILSTLGIDTLVVTVITSLRDGIFFPLLVFLVGIAGVMALWSAGKNRDYGRQAVSLILMALTIMTGTFLMFMPEKMIKAVDEIPATIERTIVGHIFATGNNTDDKLCTATGTATGVKDTDLEGKSVPYTASEGTRSLLCENWRTFAFNPWVYGQFGTNFDSLYAASTGKSNAMQNTNGSLVGNAAVVMGGGNTMNNWAVYQLDVTSSGTASFADTNVANGAVSRDFYRLVDLQAGPNNGAGTDGRFFNYWSGNDPTARMGVGLLSSIVSIVGAVTVIIYSFAKIQIAFVVTLMLMIMPIMFLIGVHPTMGRMKLKGYVGSILGLILQRIVLVLLLAVMFRVLSGIGTVTTDYFLMALLSIVICVAFLSFRKPILDMIFSGISNTMGAPVGEQFIRSPKDFAAQNGIRTPSALNNWISMQKTGISSATSGAIGGFITGGISGARRGLNENREINKGILANRQRRIGFGPLQTGIEAARAGKDSAQKELDNDVYVSKVKEDILKNTQQYRDYEESLKYWDELPKQTIDGKEVAVDPTTGEMIAKPEKPMMNTRDMNTSARANRRLAKMADVQRELDNKVIRKEEKALKKRSKREIAGNADKGFDEYLSDASRYKEEFDRTQTVEGQKEAEEDKERLSRKKKYLAENTEKVAKKSSSRYVKSKDSEMKQTLDDLRKRAENYSAFIKEQEEKDYLEKVEEQMLNEEYDPGATDPVEYDFDDGFDDAPIVDEVPYDPEYDGYVPDEEEWRK